MAWWVRDPARRMAAVLMISIDYRRKKGSHDVQEEGQGPLEEKKTKIPFTIYR
jgi:hypothetical protein